LRKYVQTKKRRMKIGDALVGMKRRGSQLRTVVSETCGKGAWIMRNMTVMKKKEKEKKKKSGNVTVTYLLRQNMMSEEESGKIQGLYG
jgi:hypothetical protein